MIIHPSASSLIRYGMMAGLMICAFAIQPQCVEAQPGGDPFGPLPHVSFEAVNPVPWFSHPAVRQELNWPEETHRKVVAQYGNQFARYTESIDQLPKNLTPTQRRQRERDLMQNFHAQLQSSLDESLKDEAARARYEQLHLQYQGNSVVHHPEVQKQLKITKEQRELLLKEDAAWSKALDAYWKKHKSDPKAAEKEFEAAREKLSERMTNTLDSTQQETWRQMTGKPYRVPADAYLMTHPKNVPETNAKSK